MKVNVSVEATAQEMREFLGLPNLQPLHDDILQKVRDNMQRGGINFDNLNLIKPLLSGQLNSMEMMQKFWEAVAKASGGSMTATIKDAAARSNIDPSPESHEKDTVRGNTDKSA